jgi:hypothetical protein
MKRTAGFFLVLAALGGCATSDNKSCRTCGGGGGAVPPTVSGIQGTWGQPIVMNPAYSGSPTDLEQAMKDQHALKPIVPSNPAKKGKSPAELMQAAAWTDPGANGAITPVGHGCINGSCPANVMTSSGVPPTRGCVPPGAVAASGALTPDMASRFTTQRTSVRFISPTGMKVSWYTSGTNAKGGMELNELRVPGRYNFAQAAIYRLKLSNIPKLPGVDLYPTLEVVPSNARTDTFLAHSAVPVAFTDEDFDQVASGNYVMKVIYLPDPPFQDLATVGLGEIVSSRLEAGADPIAEASRRGSILLVIRLGNIDLEAPNTPGMDVPSPHMMRGGMPGGHMGPHGSIMPDGSTPTSSMGQPSAKMASPSNIQSADYLVPGDSNADMAKPEEKRSGFLKLFHR